MHQGAVQQQASAVGRPGLAEGAAFVSDYNRTLSSMLRSGHEIFPDRFETYMLCDLCTGIRANGFIPGFKIPGCLFEVTHSNRSRWTLLGHRKQNDSRCPRTTVS